MLLNVRQINFGKRFLCVAPHTTENVKKLEAVQRRTAQYVCSDYKPESSPTSMLQQLQWPTPQLRRQQAKDVMMYTIVNNLVAIPKDMHLFHSQSTTRGHDLRFHQRSSV